MMMAKKKFEGWRWESIDAEVTCNKKDKVEIYLSGAIAPKKNSRQNFGRISLPSQNYIEWHKRIMSKLGNVERKFKSPSCEINITSIVGDRVKSDCDNQVSSIMDTLVDLGVIKDDNRFIVKEIRVKNVGYAKNCWLTRIEITPYILCEYDLLDEHKGTNLLDYKNYLSGFCPDY